MEWGSADGVRVQQTDWGKQAGEAVQRLQERMCGRSTEWPAARGGLRASEQKRLDRGGARWG